MRSSLRSRTFILRITVLPSGALNISGIKYLGFLPLDFLYFLIGTSPNFLAFAAAFAMPFTLLSENMRSLSSAVGPEDSVDSFDLDSTLAAYNF